MAEFFSSDHHFFHEKVIQFEDRPYRDAQEMTEGLINRWNAEVKPGDIVYHLGDFAITGYSNKYTPKVSELLSRLNGTKHLYQGNHDAISVAQNPGWAVVRRLGTINIRGQRIVLCHYPIASWQYKAHGSWMLHGHCHGKLAEPSTKMNRADVGVDSPLGKTFSYGPIPFEFLKEIWFKEQHT